MRIKGIKAFQLALLSALWIFPPLASLLASQPGTDSWSLGSPDGHCAITVFLDEAGRLSYQAAREQRTVIGRSPLGLRRDDQSFDRGLLLTHAGEVEPRREAYDLFAGTRPHVEDLLNHRTLSFLNTNHGALEIELAASAEGVAFRYRFPETAQQVRVVQEEFTGFALPRDARGWLQPYHAASLYTPAYEDFYFHVFPGEPPPHSRAKAVGWGFPALFHVSAAGGWVLLTESGTDESYCACHLDADSSGGLYHVAFPLADETTKGWTNRFGPEPRYTLPWTMPWRVIVLGQTACDIATSTLVTDLAPPSQVQETSWITPGRASWGWWSHPEGPATAELFDRFADLAARMHWEYTLYDAGWQRAGLKAVSEYARAKEIRPLAWLFAADFYDPVKREKRLSEMTAAGIRGVKVDFWCSDRQEAITAQQALMREAASRHLVVNLHGCTIPRGWQRTWPNFLTCEAVLGTESYFFESRYPERAAELNTVLPFTRNAIGPMDSTPVACSLKKYRRLTTAAHELATAIILTSGLIHYADGPEFFGSLPAEAQRMLRDAPARWDETKCVAGEPGKVVVFARRSRNSWFIAGLNGLSEPLPLDVDLAAYRDFPTRIAIIEGVDATMQVATSSLEPSARWHHEMPARGGFILRLDQ